MLQPTTRDADGAQPLVGPVPALDVSEIVKRFGHTMAVAGVSFAIQPGELVSLLGPSGCGKSTLLRIIAGIERPDAGRIVIGGRLATDASRRRSLPPEKRGLGMVFQSYALWPHMTVAANVEYPLRCQRVDRDQRRQRVGQALAAVHLDGYEKRYPGQLSGGQQQRVALARALVAEPAVILLDEPLSNLDARLREQMRQEIKRLQVERSLTMLYVTHDQSEALALSDRVVLMQTGRIVQTGRPEVLYGEPANSDVALFLGASNQLAGQHAGNGSVRLQAGGELPCRVQPDLPVGATVKVSFRPESARATIPGEAGLQGCILRAGFLGGAYEYVLRLSSGEEVLARLQARLGEPGDSVRFALDPESTHAFLD